MLLEGWTVPLGPRVGIEPTSEPEPKFRLNQLDRRDRFAREISQSPWHIEKREIYMPSPAWSWWRDSNPRHSEYKTETLSTELHQQILVGSLAPAHSDRMKKWIL